MSDKREQFLLLRIRAFNDKSAFASLVDKHSSALMRFLSMRLRRTHDAEDCYSEVLIQTWNYITRTEVKHFSGLLYTIARNTVAEHYRKHSKVEITSIEYETGEPLPIPSKVTAERIMDQVDAGFMLKLIKKLPEEEQEVIVMRHLDGYRVKDIAQHIGKTDNATAVMLHRAFKKLKDLYERS